MMFSSLAAGFRAIRRRPGLALLLFLLYLGLALVLTVPLSAMLTSMVSESGFDADLVRHLDFVLFADIVLERPDAVAALFGQLIWAVPLLVAWKAATGVGLVHALRDGGVRPFWTGVSRYFFPGLLLGLVFLVPAMVWGAVVVVLYIVAGLIFDGPVTGFWVGNVVVPTLAISGWAAIGVMHDFGRIMVVCEDRPVMDAWLKGMRFPVRHGAASFVYIAWFAIAGALWLLPTVVEGFLGVTLVVFLLQQVVLFGRAAATVGWVGSEVALFEAVRRREAPLIAEADAAAPAPETGPLTDDSAGSPALDPGLA